MILNDFIEILTFVLRHKTYRKVNLNKINAKFTKSLILLKLEDNTHFEISTYKQNVIV